MVDNIERIKQWKDESVSADISWNQFFMDMMDVDLDIEE